MGKKHLKRSREEVARDRALIADKYLAGWRQIDIAAELFRMFGYRLTQQQISLDIKHLQKTWLAASMRDFDAARAEELKKVDNLERIHWEAWEKSCKDRPMRKGKEKYDPSMYDGRDGNSKHLDGVKWCINKRCEILGLDKPKKLALTDPDGGPITFVYPVNGREPTDG